LKLPGENGVSSLLVMSYLSWFILLKILNNIVGKEWLGADWAIGAHVVLATLPGAALN